MKRFKVSILEEQGGYLYFDAENKEDAVEKAQELLNEHGMDNMPNDYTLHITHRGCDVHFAEEFKD